MEPSGEREAALFAQALKRPVAERATFLEAACAGDSTLRQRLAALLAAHAQPDVLPGVQSGTVAATVRMGTNTQVTDPALGEVVGRYKLREKIGEGGCGNVYVADQEEPVRRRVALKVIKLGMDTKSVIARFEAERQALAMMDHPGIAKVLDAGTTERGRPYFVMELVRGIRITEYCDQNKLSTRERLDLFIKVCQAVQHAHQKGIIHRDIKPSNILVTLHDGVPVPKVIDFGIAKATEGRLTDKTIYTELHQFIGTPAYMSPEQAEMSGLDIDTRSDIYSLGVLLYELLTGKTPFDPKELLDAGFDQMRRTIREREPARPSTRLSTMLEGELTTTARHHGADAPKLIHLVRGDLDWIVMKCLEKDRTRRYETASGLAADLMRHLSNEPVMACPPSVTYKFQKAFRRNKLAFAAAGGVFSALVFGLSLATWMYFNQRVAYQAASAAKQEALTEAMRSKQIAQFMQEMLQGVGPSKALGRDTQMLREILDKTVERLSTDLKGQPQVEVSLRSTLGSVYIELGEYAQAERVLRAALPILPNDLRWRTHVQSNLGKAVLGQRRMDEAEVLFRESLENYRKLFGYEHEQVAIAIENLGCVFQQQGRLSEAESMFQEALSMFRRLPGYDGKHYAWLQLNLAKVVIFQGRAVESEQLHRNALALISKEYGRNHLGTSDALNSTASVLSILGKDTEAESLYREAVDINRKLLGEAHPEVSSTVQNLAALLQKTGRNKEAESLYRDTLARQRQAGGPRHPAVVDTLCSFGSFLTKQGRFTEAKDLHETALAIRRELCGPEDRAVVLALTELGSTYLAWEKPTNAECFLREAVEISRKLGRYEQDELVRSLINLGNALSDSDKLADAEGTYREAVDLARKLYGDSNERTALALENLGSVLTKRRRYAEADSALAEALATARKLSDTNRMTSVLGRIGSLAFAQRNYARAEAMYREAVSTQRNAGGEVRKMIAYLDNLGWAIDQQGRLPEAEVFYREAVGIADRQPTAELCKAAGRVRQNLFHLLSRQRRWAEAEAVAREAVKLEREGPAPSSSALEDRLFELALVQYRGGKYSEADASYRERLASLRHRHSPTNDKVLKTAASLGRCLSEWALGEPAAPASLERAREGERLLRECFTIREGITNIGRGVLGDTRSRLGGALMAVALCDATLSRDDRNLWFAEVESLLLAGQDLMAKSSKPEPDHQQDGFLRLVRLYEVWDKSTEAAEWRRKQAVLTTKEQNLQAASREMLREDSHQSDTRPKGQNDQDTLHLFK